MATGMQLAQIHELDIEKRCRVSLQLADRSDRISWTRTEKGRSSLLPKVEMDTHLKFSSSVTSEGFLPLRDASLVSEKTQKTSSSRACKKPSSTCTNSKGNLASPPG